MAVDVGLNQGLKFFRDAIALEGDRFDAIFINRSHGIFTGSWQADANIGVLAFAGSVNNATHNGNLHVLDTVINALPFRHLVPDVALDVLGELLEVGAGCPTASGACRHQRKERSETHGLENLLRHDDFLCTVIELRLWGQRDANRISDALLQQNGERRAR